jgi:hypothetical protein
MANLTITVDDDVLRQARIRALEQGTSVNALLRSCLESYAGTPAAHQRAIRSLLGLSARARSARGGRRWTRDELHER